MRKSILCITSLLITNYGICWPTIINIPADYPSIQQGIDASTNGDTVLVQPGTYTENIRVYSKSITLTSNFIFSGDSLDISNTVVLGNPSHYIMFLVIGGGAKRIVGLTIKNEVWKFTDTAILSVNCKIENCVIEDLSGYALDASHTEISECTIRNIENDAIFMLDTDVIVRNNDIYDNISSVLMNHWENPLLVEDNRIHDNEGVIFYCWWNNEPAIFRRNLIYNNHCSYCGLYGGIFTTEDTYILAENNVIFNNSGSNQSYLAVFGINHYETEVNFVNNIIWNNSYPNPGEPLIDDHWVDFSMTYSDVQGGWAGEGNIECDPQFCDPDSGNFYLRDSSCCVGAGQNGENMGVYGIGCWSPCGAYVVGDVNGSGIYDGLDIIYGVAFLKGDPAPTLQCECTEGNILYPAGDVNNSCSYNGLDITYGVAYFKGGSAPVPCQDCPPVLDSIRK